MPIFVRYMRNFRHDLLHKNVDKMTLRERERERERESRGIGRRPVRGSGSHVTEEVANNREVVVVGKKSLPMGKKSSIKKIRQTICAKDIMFEAK